MGKIRVEAIPGGGGCGWEKLTEENVTMSGGKKDASAVAVDSHQTPYSAAGYDLLLVDASFTVTCGAGAFGAVSISNSRSAPFAKSGKGLGRTRLLFTRDCEGRFVSQNDRTGAYPTADDLTVSFTLSAGGDGSTVYATGSVRVYGAKIDV